MKITDLQLEDYGIYKKVSIKPSQNQLVVVMGQNESGKTTLLHFIRDMLFGFSRGNWKGRKGNMAFIRSNGDTYRLFRHEKDTCFIDAANEKYTEELPELWWHGLTRSMYEHIFAVGLEDLQGTRLLTDESVKSRFFMMQGGDHLNDAKEVLSKVSSQEDIDEALATLNKAYEALTENKKEEPTNPSDKKDESTNKKDETVKTETKKNTQKSKVKTGDNTAITAFAVMMFISGCVFVLARRKRND